MKKVMFTAILVFTALSTGMAVSRDGTRSMSDFTGEVVEMSKSVVGGTVSVVAPYSTSRGALTVLNISTNTIYLSSTSVTTGNAANTFALPAGQSIQFRNNAALFGVLDTGISSMTIHVIKEY